MSDLLKKAQELGIAPNKIVKSHLYREDFTKAKEWISFLTDFLQQNNLDDASVEIELRTTYDNEPEITGISVSKVLPRDDSELHKEIADKLLERQKQADQKLALERAEYERLRAKFGQ